jgi:hypothetical protein
MKDIVAAEEGMVGIMGETTELQQHQQLEGPGNEEQEGTVVSMKEVLVVRAGKGRRGDKMVEE